MGSSEMTPFFLVRLSPLSRLRDRDTVHRSTYRGPVWLRLPRWNNERLYGSYGSTHNEERFDDVRSSSALIAVDKPSVTRGKLSTTTPNRALLHLRLKSSDSGLEGLVLRLEGISRLVGLPGLILQPRDQLILLPDGRILLIEVVQNLLPLLDSLAVVGVAFLALLIARTYPRQDELLLAHRLGTLILMVAVLLSLVLLFLGERGGGRVVSRHLG